MTTTLTTEQKAMVRESARGLNGSTADTFETNVIARLDAMVAQGIGITVAQVRTACSQQLSQGK
jgi:hypothetical protein